MKFKKEGNNILMLATPEEFEQYMGLMHPLTLVASEKLLQDGYDNIIINYTMSTHREVSIMVLDYKEKAE